MEKGFISKLLRKIVTVFMTLAFFYLVIGDLILFHEKVIYNYDAFASHQPFSKPNKTEKVYKVKDKSDGGHINLLFFAFTPLHFHDNRFSYSCNELSCYLFGCDADDNIFSSISHRGPPRFYTTNTCC